MKIAKKIMRKFKEQGILSTIKWGINSLKFKIYSAKKIKTIDYNKIVNKSVNLDDVIIKNKKRIFIFANIPYYDIGGGQRSSQLAKTFDKMGYQVLYIYGYKSGEDKIPSLLIPAVMHMFIENLNINDFDFNKEDIVVFEAPSEKYIDFLNKAFEAKSNIVYESIDNWETSLGDGVFSRDTLNDFLTKSNILVATAKPLVDQLNGYLKELKIKKEIVYLPNAVDDELFCPFKNYDKPKDMILGEKTFIYYGSLWGSWFDWDLLINFAKSNKNYSINLIGDTSNIKDIMSKCPNNIHFLGLKKQTELPAYLKYVDFSLLPFKMGDIVEYVSPLKVFEYISMNTKILSTPLPDIKNYPNCYFGENAYEWEEVVKQDKSISYSKRDEFVNSNNWYERCSRIVELFENKNSVIEKNYSNISIIILNYNNKNIINRCIDSLIKYNKRYNYEIIVVDNNSTDGSYEELKVKYKNKIKLVKNKVNGCSSGRNLGVENATKDYILFLDSDQWVLNDYWLDNYLELIESNNKIGAIGWAAGWFDDNGYSYRTVDQFPYSSLAPNLLARKDIGYLGAGGMFMKKELFKKINGFDINYDPTCYEDTDISLKIRHEGYELLYCRYLGVFHLPHQTTKDGSESHLNLTNKKAKYFINKWMKIDKTLLEYKK